MQHCEGHGLQLWARKNVPEDEDSVWSQVMFVRDQVTRLFYKEANDLHVQVVGTHTSKSRLLPVYSIAVPELEVRMRSNWHDWKVSVVSKNPILLPDLFHQMIGSGRPEPTCMEGFERDWIFGSFRDSTTRFSYECTTNYDLYTSLYLVTTAAGVRSWANRWGWRSQ